MSKEFFNSLTDDELRGFKEKGWDSLSNERLVQYKEMQEGGLPEVDKMHEDVSVWDRWKLKNTSANPQEAFNFLKREYPDHIIQERKDGGYKIRRKDQGEWYRLDPDGYNGSLWDSIKEGVMDATDLTTDIGGAVVEGAGDAVITAGAALGALPSGGATIPAAMAGYGAMGAGVEGARQGLGRLLGVNESFDGENIALHGTLSAAMPVVGKFAGRGIKAVTSGANKGIKKAGASALSLGSGKDKELIERIGIDEAGGLAVGDNPKAYMKDLAGRVGEGLRETKRAANKDIVNSLDDSGDIVLSNREEIASILENIPEYQHLAEKLRNVDTMSSKIAGGTYSGISPHDARTIKQAISDVANLDRDKAIQTYGEKISNVFKRADNARIRELGAGVKKELEDHVQNKSLADFNRYSEGNAKYAKISEIKDGELFRKLVNKDKDKSFEYVSKAFADDGFKDKFLRNASELGMESGVDVEKAAREVANYNEFINPKDSLISFNKNRSGAGALGFGAGVAIGIQSGLGYGASIMLGGALAGIGNAATSGKGIKAAYNVIKGMERKGQITAEQAERVYNTLILNGKIRGDKAIVNPYINSTNQNNEGL